MALFRGQHAATLLICFISSVIIPIVLSKSCRKLDACKCEMDDGTGTISLWNLDNPDGKPSFTNIPDTSGPEYTYNFNPCTTIKNEAACKGSNLCQDDTTYRTYYPCDASVPSFKVESNHVVMTFSSRTQASYTRTSKITLVCDKNNEKGSFGVGITQIPGTLSAIYSATLSAKSACPVPPPSSSSSSTPSTGSILLIIFFPLVLLYLIFGILFNIYVRHKQSVPEVLPNHTFWADFPFLVKPWMKDDVQVYVTDREVVSPVQPVPCTHSRWDSMKISRNNRSAAYGNS